MFATRPTKNQPPLQYLEDRKCKQEEEAPISSKMHTPLPLKSPYHAPSIASWKKDTNWAGWWGHISIIVLSIQQRFYAYWIESLIAGGRCDSTDKPTLPNVDEKRAYVRQGGGK